MSQATTRVLVESIAERIERAARDALQRRGHFTLGYLREETGCSDDYIKKTVTKLVKLGVVEGHGYTNRRTFTRPGELPPEDGGAVPFKPSVHVELDDPDKTHQAVEVCWVCQHESRARTHAEALELSQQHIRSSRARVKRPAPPPTVVESTRSTPATQEWVAPDEEAPAIPAELEELVEPIGTVEALTQLIREDPPVEPEQEGAPGAAMLEEVKAQPPHSDQAPELAPIFICAVCGISSPSEEAAQHHRGAYFHWTPAEEAALATARLAAQAEVVPVQEVERRLGLSDPLEAWRDRYIELLLDRAATDVDVALLDRIERVLGLAS